MFWVVVQLISLTSDMVFKLMPTWLHQLVISLYLFRVCSLTMSGDHSIAEKLLKMTMITSNEKVFLFQHVNIPRIMRTLRHFQHYFCYIVPVNFIGVSPLVLGRVPQKEVNKWIKKYIFGII